MGHKVLAGKSSLAKYRVQRAANRRADSDRAVAALGRAFFLGCFFRYQLASSQIYGQTWGRGVSSPLHQSRAWHFVPIMQQINPLQKPDQFLFDVGALLDWYDEKARLLPWRIGPGERMHGVQPDPYRVWLSEIMLQQTTIVTVKDYFNRFVSRWPQVEDLARAPLNDVLAAWAGLGYYARARNLHAAAQVVATRMGGYFPRKEEALRDLPGVGPYTSAAIAAICYDEKIAVIDGNVERVMARVLLLNRPVREAKPLIRESVQTLVPPRAGDFAQAMMDLGATICAPRRANCPSCPLNKDCAAAILPDPTIYPLKSPKAQRPVRYGHAYVLTNPHGAIWLQRRPDTGLLAKMTETPGSNWESAPQEPAFPQPGKWGNKGNVVHIFTHFRLELQVWSLVTRDDQPCPQGWWSAQENLDEEALPSLYRKVLAVHWNSAQKNAAGFKPAAVGPD